MLTHNLGYPRIGAQRQLKKACEAYWADKISLEQLQEAGKVLRKDNWLLQRDAGIDLIPCNDFSLYDHVLDMTLALGAVPERYRPLVHDERHTEIDLYFAMARGYQGKGLDLIAMEMTKWFDTNYHYLVPEFHKGQTFKLSSRKILDEFCEAQELGIRPKPILLGPLTYLLLGKEKHAGFHRLELLPALLPVYGELLVELQSAGAEYVQIDEPFLAMDLDDCAKAAYRSAYEAIHFAARNLKIIVATYFDGLRENIELAVQLPVHALHIDLVRAPDQLTAVLASIPSNLTLSLGLVDGRNIWKNDFAQSLAGLALSATHRRLAKRLAKNLADTQDRKHSSLINKSHVRERLETVDDSQTQRVSPFRVRQNKQRTALRLPIFPTTTIGSFPQTAEIRRLRAKLRAGEMTETVYEEQIKAAIEKAIRWQETIGIDVLVHGEFERNDMVEYFGEHFDGFAFTQNGWVQSYGSRCVKPPIIYGDVERKAPMTVEWSAYAQSLTDKVVKGMLTGPVTILQWSFVRDDQSRAVTAMQIALAIRDEVKDLENAGIRVIQIDEPAIREGLPLPQSDRPGYLEWTVKAFRLASCCVCDETQIHTHMCYSEFNDIIQSIADMDADVITIETSRSKMELLDVFVDFDYPNDIGPGVYDIHSPRVPTQEEMLALLERAMTVIPAKRLWVNPDCGLKTRGWPEVEAALINMMRATRLVRERFTEKPA